MPQPNVFISYSHRDEIWKDRLRPHLRVLEQQGQIAIWDDRQIDAGAGWFNEIKQVMDKAAVSICLISADYLASDFCGKEEIPYLLERRKNNGLCVITTREPVADLQEAGPAALQKNLEQISPQAGRALLRVGGVQGTDAELEKATDDFGNHALAIILLAAYLHDIPGHHISHRREIPDLDIPEEKGKHPGRVMAAFEQRWGESPALQVLRILGLFDRPAELAAVEAVRRPPAIAGLTDQLQNLTEGQWLEVLENLRQHKLLAPRSLHHLDSLDCHPLVREHFGEKLKVDNATAWKEAHSRLYEYYVAATKKEFPQTFEEIVPLYAAVIHGCQASLYKESKELFWRRILRERTHFSRNKLSAFSADLASLSNFFEDLWDRPFAALPDLDKLFVLVEVGFYLRIMVRLREAESALLTGLQFSKTQNNADYAARAAHNLGELYLTKGSLDLALDYAKESVDLADASGDPFLRMVTRTASADALHQAGRFSEAEVKFFEAEKVQEARQPEIPLLYSGWGLQYCELLQAQGKYREVLDRVGKTMKWAEENLGLRAVAIDHMSLGVIYMLENQKGNTNDFGLAKSHIDLAIRGLRQAGRFEELPRVLLAQSELHRVIQDYVKTQRHLDEAFTIAERGGMLLLEADCHLEYARLYLAMGEKDKARESWAKSKKMIEEMGYHRRDPEIHLIEAQLHLSSGEKDKARESLANAKGLIDTMGMHRWDFEVKEIEKKIS